MLVSSYHRYPKMSTVFLKKIYYAAKRSGKGVTPLSLRLNFVFCDYLL